MLSVVAWRRPQDHLEQRPRDEGRGEEVGHQAEDQRRREAPDRARAELEEEGRRDERRDVGVDQRQEDALEPGVDRRACTPRCAASSSLMRSKTSTLESTPMPIVRMKPATPGSVIVAPR